MKSGKMLLKSNIVDLVDLITRRKRIAPSYCVIFRNFLLQNLVCCRKGCLLTSERARKE